MIKFKKEKGVSEVIGTLLILTITVILFSSVFYYVATMPPPKSQVYASFQASYSINNEGFANITITNVTTIPPVFKLLSLLCCIVQY